MKNTQNFINSLIAYEIILGAISRKEKPMQAIKQYDRVINVLNVKPVGELTTDLKKLNIKDSTIKVLKKVNNPNHAILPLLLAYYNYPTIDGFSVDFIEKTLSSYQFSDNDLWIFYEAITCSNNVGTLPVSFQLINKRKNEAKEIILSHISDSPRKRYEKAKLLIHKGA